MYNLFSKRLNNKRRGFTLVELLVVIAILAILIAIVVMQTSRITDKAAVTTHNANVRALESAVALAVADGWTPVNVSDLSESNAPKEITKYLKGAPDFNKVKSAVIQAYDGATAYGVSWDNTNKVWNIYPGPVKISEDNKVVVDGEEVTQP